MKSVESSFTFAIWTYSVIIIHNMYVNLVDEGCDILFLPGDELHHARVPHLFFCTDISSKHMRIHICSCVCLSDTWLDYAYACHVIFIHTGAISITSLISCICLKWLSTIHICAMSYPTVHVPWLIQPYACHPSHRFGLLRSVNRLIQPYVCHDWCLHMCVMTHQTSHSSLCEPRWFLRMCAKTDSAICAPPPYMHAPSHTHT